MDSQDDIFLNAREIADPTERATYLAQACGADPDLRSRVESMLRDADGAKDFFGADENLPGMVAAPLTEVPGTVIGRYKLLQKIGEGGMGVVYMAEQREPVVRKVALKIIKLGMDTRQVLGRFEAERQALALMDHPNIAKILDGGATDTGRPYFVMDLVQGLPITRFCDEANLPTRDRLDLFLEVCSAIQHAHQKGIIHRDIKPANILVTLHGDKPVPKVIDFGIAKATQGRLTEKTIFTQFQHFIGTPAYMSPEQASLSGLDVDTRSDIYGLGVLLYELLTGRTPFDEKELMKAGLDEMRRTIREVEPLRPSTRLTQELARSSGRLPRPARDERGEGGGRGAADESPVAYQGASSPRPSPPLDGGEGVVSVSSGISSPRLVQLKELIHVLRGDLDWIVMKCLEKDRARRYETANGLAADLKRHLSNEPVIARPPSTVYRLQKTLRRNRLFFAAAGAVALTLIAGLSFSTWSLRRERKAFASEAEQRRIAVEARKNETQLRLQSDRRVYAADMKLVQRALEMNNIDSALNLLNRYRPTNKSEIDFRGWEWRYLWNQCQQSDAESIFCKTPSSIKSLSVSHDGAWLATGLTQTGVVIWDVATRQEITRLPGGGDIVYVAFSPRELLLAYSDVPNYGSSRTNHSVHLWDGVNRRVRTLPLSDKPYGVAFSNDGRILITSTRNLEGANPLFPGFITLWRVSDGSMVTNYPVRQYGPGEGTPFALAGDLSIAAHLSENDKVCVIDLATGQERWKRKGTDDYLMSLALSPDGKILASGEGYSDSVIRLWDVASGRELGRLEGHRAGIFHLVFWPDGKTLASASLDQTIRLWDVRDPTNGHPVNILRGHRSCVRSLALLPDNTTLVSASDDGTVCLWNTARTPQERKYLTLPRSSIHVPIYDGGVCPWRITPDSKSLVTLEDDQDGVSRMVRWQGADFQTMQPLLVVGTNIHEGCFSGDGRWLAVSGARGEVKVWDLENRQSYEFNAHTQPVIPRGFIAGGKKLMVVHTKDNSLHEWDLTTRQETRSWPPAEGRYTGVLSPDGKWHLTSIQNPDIRTVTSLTELPGGRQIDLRLPWFSAAAFSPDGKLFSLGGWGNDVRLFETATTKEVVKLRGIFGGVRAVGFSPDGRRFMTGHGSGGVESVALWDMESHEKLLALEGRGSLFDALAFSPDGNVLAASNVHGVLYLWRAPSWAEIEAAEKAQTK